MKLLAAIDCKFICLLFLQPLVVPYFQASLPSLYPYILEEGTQVERNRQRQAGLPAVQGARSFQRLPLLPTSDCSLQAAQGVQRLPPFWGLATNTW